MASFDEREHAYMREPIGILEGGPLTPKNEMAELPQFLFEDTALLDLVNRVQLHYSSADVSMAAAFNIDANIEPVEIYRTDVSYIYPHDNTIYLLELTGAQLIILMEWTARLYDRYQPHDLTFVFVPGTNVNMADAYEGVNYEVDVSAEEGSRIRNLRWPDGTAVFNDVPTLAANNYRTNSNLLVPGDVLEKGDLPKLLEIDVASSLGGIRGLIGEYIGNVHVGTIANEVDDPWRIVGAEWDPTLHQQAIELIAQGTLSVAKESERDLPEVIITENDIADVGGA